MSIKLINDLVNKYHSISNVNNKIVYCLRNDGKVIRYSEGIEKTILDGNGDFDKLELPIKHTVLSQSFCIVDSIDKIAEIRKAMGM